MPAIIPRQHDRHHHGAFYGRGRAWMDDSLIRSGGR